MGAVTNLLNISQVIESSLLSTISKLNTLLILASYGLVGKNSSGKIDSTLLYETVLPQFTITDLPNGDKTAKLDITKLDAGKLNSIIDSRLAMVTPATSSQGYPTTYTNTYPGTYSGTTAINTTYTTTYNNTY